MHAKCMNVPCSLLLQILSYQKLIFEMKRDQWEKWGILVYILLFIIEKIICWHPGLFYSWFWGRRVRANAIVQHSVRFSPFHILPSTLFAFWKLVFHGEEHHQSNSRDALNYFLHTTFGQCRAQLLTDVSYKGKALLWCLLSCTRSVILRQGDAVTLHSDDKQ